MWLELWVFFIPTSRRHKLQLSFLTGLGGSLLPNTMGHSSRGGPHQCHAEYVKLCPELASPSGTHGGVHISESF